MTTQRRLAWTLLVVATWLLSARSAGAHPTPGSFAFVDFTIDGARIEQDVPIEELQRALHRPLVAEGETPESAARRWEEVLRSYVLEHLRAATAGSGRPWSVALTDVSGHASEDGPRFRFRFELRAPEGDASSSLTLHDEIVAHEVVTHYTTVYVRSDWAAGILTAEPRLAGTLHAGRNDLLLARRGSFWRGLRSIMALGGEHIATGTDHLAFLFLLVLGAPAAAAGTRGALLRLLGVVSAFTVGHTLTLVAQTIGLVSVPSEIVEPVIALSIVVTAAHVLRPRLPRAERLLAGSFGLVHGLAFASGLAGQGLGRAQTAWALFGFNLGIEIAQVTAIALVAPWVFLLTRSRWDGVFRVTGASVTAAVAVGWLVERVSVHPNPLGFLVAAVEGHPAASLASLAAIAIVARATTPADEPLGAGEQSGDGVMKLR